MSKNFLFIINGKPTSGKDTFVWQFGQIASEAGFYNEVENVSSIDEVIVAAKALGYTGKKTPEERNLLSALKDASTAFNDGPFKYVVKQRLTSRKKFMFAHLREPAEIEKLYRRFEEDYNVKCIRIMIDRDIEVTASNHADNNTTSAKYDVVVDNNGTLKQFYKNTKTFFESLKF